MTDFALKLDPATLPPPPDPSLARAGLERWHERIAGSGDDALIAFGAAVDADAGASRLLNLVFAHSHYLTQSILS